MHTLRTLSRIVSQLQPSLCLATSYLAEEDARATKQYETSLHESKEARRSLECLPDDVLFTIISFSLGGRSYDQKYVLLPLSKLSRRFCSLVYGTPAFWTAVVVPRHDDLELQRALVCSKKAGLQITVDVSQYRLS